MADRADITPELCRQLLRYEPETGKLFWRERSADTFSPYRNRWGGINSAEVMAKTWNSTRSGIEAFTCINANGYLSGRIDRKGFLAHRVIWAMVTGAWPENSIDHIDGSRTNNRFDNLREADHRINGMNTQLRTDNKSGRIGVHWCSKTGKWAAEIMVNQKTIYLGRHIDLADACAARDAAENLYGFHKNHGRQTALPRHSQPKPSVSRTADCNE